MAEEHGGSISMKEVSDDIRSLFLEAAIGPNDPRGTWFTDNEEESGLLGSVRKLDASTAFATPTKGLDSIAAHVQHITFAIDLGLRAYRGENAHEGANWAKSWVITEKTSAAWQTILSDFESAVNSLATVADGGLDLSEPMTRKGTIALVAHVAWHLGAVQQLRALVS